MRFHVLWEFIWCIPNVQGNRVFKDERYKIAYENIKKGYSNLQ